MYIFKKFCVTLRAKSATLRSIAVNVKRILRIYKFPNTDMRETCFLSKNGFWCSISAGLQVR